MCVDIETVSIWFAVWMMIAIYIRGIVTIVDKYKENLSRMNKFNSFITEVAITFLMPIYLISDLIEDSVFWSKRK